MLFRSGGKPNDELTKLVKKDGQTVSLTLTEGFEALEGKVVTLRILASLKDRANISKYKDGKIPNVATIKLNDEDEVKSNEVTIVLSEEIIEVLLPKTGSISETWMLYLGVILLILGTSLVVLLNRKPRRANK